MIVKSVSAMRQEYKRTIYVEGGVREAPQAGACQGTHARHEACAPGPRSLETTCPSESVTLCEEGEGMPPCRQSIGRE
jgi:hypothetical protein